MKLKQQYKSSFYKDVKKAFKKDKNYRFTLESDLCSVFFHISKNHYIQLLGITPKEFWGQNTKRKDAPFCTINVCYFSKLYNHNTSVYLRPFTFQIGHKTNTIVNPMPQVFTEALSRQRLKQKR